jgi:hypothetical protein
MFVLGDYLPKTVINNTTIQEITKSEKEKSVSKNKPLPIPANKISKKDTLPLQNSFSVDTAQFVPETKDTIEDGDIVERDHLIKVATLPIKGLNNNKTDTSFQEQLANKLGADLPFLSNIRIEIWESPLGFSGYKLNKSILVLYGISEEQAISLNYAGNSKLSMEINGNNLILQKTTEFKPLKFQ